MRQDNDWEESTEGDLDPDLTEEAGYSGWDPPDRSSWAVIQRLLMLATLLSIVGGALLILTR
jgi:hypothetical protein